MGGMASPFLKEMINTSTLLTIGFRETIPKGRWFDPRCRHEGVFQLQASEWRVVGTTYSVPFFSARVPLCEPLNPKPTPGCALTSLKKCSVGDCVCA